jgi:phage shock protein PspC (stress-responsive transcriptional regulator)
MKKFRKSKENVVLTGILGGVGEYFEMDPVVIRLLFLFFVFLTGFFPGVFFYIVAALLLPEKLEGKRKVVEAEVE